MVDVNKLIREHIFEVQRDATEKATKHLEGFLKFQNLTLEDFAKDYVFEWYPTQIEDAITGTVGMDLDLRSDTTTVKFVTYYRIRRKTDRERAKEGNGEETDGE